VTSKEAGEYDFEIHIFPYKFCLAFTLFPRLTGYVYFGKLTDNSWDVIFEKGRW
jgi:hypothetical protein